MIEDPFAFKALATATLVAASVFICVLAIDRGGAWRRTQFGWSLMSMSFGVWLFALTGTLRQWFGPDYLLRQELRTFAYLLILYAVLSRLYVLLQARHRDRNRN